MSPFVRPPIIRLGDRLGARSVFLLLLGVFTATLSGLPQSSAGELDFQSTRSLFRGSLVLSDTPEAQRLIRSRAGVLEVADGVFVADRPIGGPLLGVPLYGLGLLASRLLPDLETVHRVADSVTRSEYLPHLFVGWRNSLAAALCGALLFLSSRRVGVSRRSAWFAALAFGLTTLLWPQARAGSNALPAGVFLFAGFHLLLRIRERFQRLLRPTRPDLLGIGSVLVLAVLTEPDLALCALLIALAFLVSIFSGYRRLANFALFLRKTWRFGHWMDLTWTALPLALAVGFSLGGPTHWLAPVLPRPSADAVGDLGLVLVSPGRGLVWLAPLVLLAPLGFASALRRGARVWPLCALAVLLSGLWAAHRPLGLGESWGFGPGRLVPALPFLWMGVAVAFDRAARIAWARRVAYALAGFGLVANLPGVLVDAATYQDLVEQASAPTAGETLYREAAWDPRRAQPWAHWRVLRHRLAGQGEVFPSAEVFFFQTPWPLEPRRRRERGFLHLAWIDLRDRLHARPDPALLFALVLIGAGSVTSLRALDRALP